MPDSQKKSADKGGVPLHRAYRKLPPLTPGRLAVDFLFLAGPFIALVLAAFPTLTLLISSGVRKVLSAAIPPEHIRTVFSPGPFGGAYFLSMPDRFPSVYFSFGTLSVSIAVIALVWGLRQSGKPAGAWLTFFALISAISSVFFALVPERFPYTVEMYSRLYIKTMLVIWVLIPTVLSISLAAVPSSFFAKLGLIGGTFLYSFLLGAVRYAFFLAVLRKGTLLFMPLLVFALGPMVDFVYVVSFYSMYISRVSLSLRSKGGIWRWSF